ncbi:DUF4294 domain-containing protein [Flavobacterium sp. JP2137]|uniref:DUF4294 domain-containing protein n=1 Tax=Flavobacterium sp. JP2137 TaxID=3414510 RepID=UPI003D2F9D1E
MKKLVLLLAFLTFSLGVQAQEKLKPVPQIPDDPAMSQREQDSIAEFYTMPEIFIGVNEREEKYLREMNVLRNRILRVYPYARATAENLTILNANLAKMETRRQRNTYISRSQKYLESEFKERLKKLSRKDGRILIKLIHRQTGNTTFSLIKEFKSGWSAFWSNNTARMFDLNLKSEYHPDTDLEDFYIETQLNYLFYNYRLTYQQANPPIDFNALRKKWEAQIGNSEAYPVELKE